MTNWRWFLVFKREYLQRIRSRSFLVATLLGPVVMAMILLGPSKLADMQGDKGHRIAVQDSSGLIYPGLTEVLGGSTPGERQFQLMEMPLDLSRDALIEWIREDDMDAALVLPASIKGNTGSELLSLSSFEHVEIERLRAALSRVIVTARIQRSGMDPDLVAALTNRVTLRSTRVGAEGEHDPQGVMTLAMVMAMVLYMTLVMYGVATMRAVVEEKSSKIVEVVLSSLNPTDLLAGKIVGVAAVGVTQYAAWITVSRLVMAGFSENSTTGPWSGLWGAFENMGGGMLFAFIGYFILGYLVFACLYAAIGAMVSQPSDAQQLQFPVTMLLIIPIVLMSFVLRMPDSTPARILSLIPFFSPILMFCRMAILTPPTWEIVLSIVILLLTVAVNWWLAARVYRIGILLRGKRATLKEVAKWVWQS